MKGIPSRTLTFIALAFLMGASLSAQEQDSYQSSADFSKYAEKLRQSAILKMEPGVIVPTTARALSVSGKYPWKTGIVTTLFWVGSPGAAGNTSSAWDPHWMRSFGGFDNPKASSRRNFVPAGFIPRQNPFYIALPYNDVGRMVTKPEGRVVIPWFREAFVEEGKSVCRDRWIAVRSAGGKVCYAQWSDCGPFRSDHWQYVFGNEKPKPNANQGAGLNVSPAVRDYLGLNSTDVTDWKFVDFKDVPRGPWALYGDNNHFVQLARRQKDPVVESQPPSPNAADPKDPAIIAPKIEGAAGGANQ